MIDLSFEQRVAAAVATIADEAPTEVDAEAMARLAAAGRGFSRPFRHWVAGPSWELGFALLLLALLVAMVGGAIAGGRLFLREPEDVLTERAFVEPFVGLPPEGTAPSTPETGELLLGFMGRVPGYGLGFTQVYADGRLISGTDRGITYDVVEQHLTPKGVELMRSAVLSDATLDSDLSNLNADEVNPASIGGGPGVDWGWLQVQIGEQRFQVGWSDPELPARMRDPEPWLPGHVWLDRRSMPFVASRFAVCVESADAAQSAAEAFELLPETIRSLIRSRAVASTPQAEDRRCLYEVTTADARLIAATLEMTMADTGTILRWTTGPQPDGRHEVTVELLRVLPDGGSVCNCG